MKLLTLLLIIALVLFLFYLFGSGNPFEFFTPKPYQLAWLPPSNNGGDSGCCNYDWQICSDVGCTNVVDSGSTRELSALTTKLDWATTYNIWVRAGNVSGKGDWTKVQLSTGDGVVSSISVGAELSPDGTVKVPLSAGNGRNISIWTSLSKGSIDPNTLTGDCVVSITRGGTLLLSKILPLKASLTGTVDVFAGDFASAGFPLVDFQKGDVVSADVTIRDANSIVVTEAIQDTTVTKTVPGGVTGITLQYSATPPPLPLISKYQHWIDMLYSQNPSPYATVQDAAAAALVQFNAMPAPTNPEDYQTKMSLFFLSRLRWVGVGTDTVFRGIGYFYVLLNSMGWDNPSMAAAFRLYQEVPADPKLAASFNNGITNYMWGPGGINQQSYQTQVAAVLATPTSQVRFSRGLSTTPGQFCPTVTDCSTCRPVVQAPIGTQVAQSGKTECMVVACALTSDDIPGWYGVVAGKCQCQC